MTISRRQFVSSLGIASGGLLLMSMGCRSGKPPAPSPVKGKPTAKGPIDRSVGNSLQIEPTGDRFDWPHTILRDGQTPIGQKIVYPTVHDVIVVGGGMSGMVTAWELRGTSIRWSLSRPNA